MNGSNKLMKNQITINIFFGEKKELFSLPMKLKNKGTQIREKKG